MGLALAIPAPMPPGLGQRKQASGLSDQDGKMDAFTLRPSRPMMAKGVAVKARSRCVFRATIDQAPLALIKGRYLMRSGVNDKRLHTKVGSPALKGWTTFTCRSAA